MLGFDAVARTPIASLAQTSRRLVADRGALTSTGNAAGVAATRRLVSANSGFALSGVSAGIAPSRRIIADRRIFSVVGRDAGLVVFIPNKIIAATGPFAAAGRVADLRKIAILRADGASYFLNGDGGLYLDFTNDAAVVTRETAIRLGRRLTTSSDQFSFVGYSAYLYFSSFTFEDPEIIYVPSEVKIALVDSEYRVITLEPKYYIEEPAENRVNNAEPRPRVTN